MAVTYLSVRRTDVDLKSKPSSKRNSLREYPVGTLVVSISIPSIGRRSCSTGASTSPSISNPATFEATIKAAVGAIFEKYPERKIQTP